MDSPQVEHAPYRPNSGSSKSISPKLVAISCPRRSPAKRKRTSSCFQPAFLSAVPRASFCRVLSASSQDWLPNISSSPTRSNSSPSGPSPSFFPTMEALSMMYTGFFRFTLCLPRIGDSCAVLWFLFIFVHSFLYGLLLLSGFLQKVCKKRSYSTSNKFPPSSSQLLKTGASYTDLP